MKKRLIMLFLVTALVVTSLSTPTVTEAKESAKQKLQRQLTELEQDRKEANNKIAEAQTKINNVQYTKKILSSEIEELDRLISGYLKDIEEYEVQIEQTTNDLEQTAQELDEASARVEKRDKVLKVRLRSMYEGGKVSYLDLLFGSASFGDFLTHFDSLKMIVNQDNEILIENKEDRDLIADNKVKIEADLVKLDGLLAEVDQLKATAEDEEKQKRVRVAALVEKEEELHEIEDEEEQKVVALAAETEKKLEELRKENQKESYSGKFPYSGGVFAWPVPDSQRITSQYGYRKDPFTGRTTGHNGMDIGAPQGTDIVAAADGEVILAGLHGGFGNTVIINHGGGIWSLYGHIRHNGIEVSVGDKVIKGDK
ncbi:MAG: peptidoglycan DD-metalloendopeptidase family protein, partial [Bacilli bacterium]